LRSFATQDFFEVTNIRCEFEANIEKETHPHFHTQKQRKTKEKIEK
jgi:hypothetical protein